MSFISFDKRESSTAPVSLPLREETVALISKQQTFDIVIAGGGIHGAVLARLAAFNGMRCLLLEKNDYAWATSSRSSKMAHGGLRYLEMFDFRQVYEGIRAREDLFISASHLVKPNEFFIPIKSFGERIQLGAGLWLYDLMLGTKARRHRWVSDPGPGYIYFDGIMNDARLVIENVVSARQEGALCLNYARINSTKSIPGGQVLVGWTDCLDGKHYEARAGIVVNCTGPWVPRFGRITADPSLSVCYSQGSHLLFNKKWNGPALFMPMPGKSRYYFVWPHFAGTLVGTTEREVTDLVEDPIPSADEIEEILARLTKDLPGSGLDRSTLHYCFAGIRTLPLRSRTGDVATLSRRHRWVFKDGVLSLLGGKYTTAHWTAYEGLSHVFKMAGLSKKPSSLVGRRLPGATLFDESISAFESMAAQSSVPHTVCKRTISRLGSRVRYFNEQSGDFELIGHTLLRGELRLALEIEQTETLEDLMRRRLELEYLPGHGLDIISLVCKELIAQRPARSLDDQKKDYLSRLSKIDALLGLAVPS
jgi:glycerol-3-phosphate dehydrogenase